VEKTFYAIEVYHNVFVNAKSSCYKLMTICYKLTPLNKMAHVMIRHWPS